MCAPTPKYTFDKNKIKLPHCILTKNKIPPCLWVCKKNNHIAVNGCFWCLRISMGIVIMVVLDVVTGLAVLVLGSLDCQGGNHLDGRNYRRSGQAAYQGVSFMVGIAEQCIIRKKS